MDVDCAGDEDVLENLVTDLRGEGEECQLRFCRWQGENRGILHHVRVLGV